MSYTRDTNEEGTYIGLFGRPVPVVWEDLDTDINEEEETEPEMTQLLNLSHLARNLSNTESENTSSFTAVHDLGHNEIATPEEYPIPEIPSATAEKPVQVF